MRPTPTMVSPTSSRSPTSTRIASKSLADIRYVLTHTVVAAVAALLGELCEERAPLDVRIGQVKDTQRVALRYRCQAAVHDLDVLARHRLLRDAHGRQGRLGILVAVKSHDPTVTDRH